MSVGHAQACASSTPFSARMAAVTVMAAMVVLRRSASAPTMLLRLVMMVSGMSANGRPAVRATWLRMRTRTGSMPVVGDVVEPGRLQLPLRLGRGVGAEVSQQLAAGHDVAAVPGGNVQRLGRSPVATLTLADGWRVLPSAPLHLRRLSPSRCVRFTNRFTGPVVDLRVSV